MPTIQTFCRRHHLLLAGVLVARVSALLIGWAGYDLSSRVDNEPVYTIGHDTYSQTIELGGGAVPSRCRYRPGRPLWRPA